jgi:hypothetical protein
LALSPAGAASPWQSIYSFGAETVRNILAFPGGFSPPAETITLDRNYRSTQPILAAANGMINLAHERFIKISGPTVPPPSFNTSETRLLHFCQPLIDVLLRKILSNSVALLDLALELLPFAGNFV